METKKRKIDNNYFELYKKCKLDIQEKRKREDNTEYEKNKRHKMDLIEILYKTLGVEYIYDINYKYEYGMISKIDLKNNYDLFINDSEIIKVNTYLSELIKNYIHMYQDVYIKNKKRDDEDIRDVWRCLYNIYKELIKYHINLPP